MAATSVSFNQGTQQFGGLFSEMWVAKGVIDFASAAANTTVSDTIAVPGVALGDVVMGISLSISDSSAVVRASVNSAGLVTVTLANVSALAVDLASTTVKVVVGRPNF